MLKVTLLAALALCAVGQKYNAGRAATPEEIKATDQFMAPDGTGLPPGKGTAAEGRETYSRRCARCHGQQGQGDEEGPLVGGKGTLATPKPLKTVGSFWPYATTIYDYVHRAMPFDNPGLLDANQTYSVVALILHMNGIIGEKDEMNAQTLPKVKMPNRDGFIRDTRPDTGKKKK
ncbi:MAG: c-type cytochrome [Bryobacterales bacterium]|nr:c-type cytochrome [Bryobacterales bacterium]